MKYFFMSVLLLLLFCPPVKAQVELVPVNHNVYNFMKRMQVKGIIENYSSAHLPYDRRNIYSFLQTISAGRDKLSGTDSKILDEFIIEFTPPELQKDSLVYSFFNAPSISEIFGNTKQKYLYRYADDNASLFIDGAGYLSYRSFKGDTYDNSLVLGELGIRLRGTLYNSIGYYAHITNGRQISGEKGDRITAASFDYRLASNVKFINEKYFDSFEGYLRFAPAGWFSLTAGREGLVYGFGYADRLFLSGNGPPFDFLKMDLSYKSLSYSFVYGNVKGDSLGRPIDSKNIVCNFLTINLGNFKLGLFEAVIIANRSLNFTYLNPFSFIISADYSAQLRNDDNSIMGLTFEIVPFKNFALQGTWLIDDMDFRTLFKPGGARDNKFALQAGILWNEFILPDLCLTAEYTRLDPYVYTHRTNVTAYTHWNLSLGHHLPPNSDEIILKAGYNFSQRIRMGASFSYQRSAEGFTQNTKGEIIFNSGGNLLRGDGDLNSMPAFLKGNRYDKKTLCLNLYIEPVKQIYLSINYTRIMQDIFYLGASSSDDILYFTFGTDF